MDLAQLEFAANLIFELCRQHPELCPHDYSWRWSKATDEHGYEEEHYVCNLCGHEEVRMKKDRYWTPKENDNA